MVRAGTIRREATPRPLVSTQHPDPDDYYQRVRQAWDDYRTLDRARTEASTAVTRELAAARAAGFSMYRMAKWLEVYESAIQARLKKHDQLEARDE